MVVVGSNNDLRLRILPAHHLRYGQQIPGINGDYRQRIRAHQVNGQDSCQPFADNHFLPHRLRRIREVNNVICPLFRRTGK
ncbi:Uncharacterised protein [Enterobacter hormaechei]|nr:Uncharacterised protein [Enterobacter hormaechei]CZX49219.1 Uncharacterised protein [Enterobacter hormaechei]